MSANEKQIGGSHYKTSVQHWDMLIDMGYDSQYYAGQVSKYLMRWRKKNGLRDVLKGQHFVEKMLELGAGDAQFFTHASLNTPELEALVVEKMPYLMNFFLVNEVPELEQRIITTALFAHTVEDLIAISAECETLVAIAKEEQAAGLLSTEVEQPVDVQFYFNGYSRDDSNKMFWVCKRCQALLTLDLDQPPMFHHRCPT